MLNRKRDEQEILNELMKFLPDDKMTREMAQYLSKVEKERSFITLL